MPNTQLTAYVVLYEVLCARVEAKASRSPRALSCINSIFTNLGITIDETDDGPVMLIPPYRAGTKHSYRLKYPPQQPYPRPGSLPHIPRIGFRPGRSMMPPRQAG